MDTSTPEHPGFKDRIEGEVPVRSAKGAMRSMLAMYSRIDEPSPEGFGHIILDMEDNEEARWFIDYYKKMLCNHLFENAAGKRPVGWVPATGREAEHMIKRLSPLHVKEFTDSTGTNPTQEDRPFPPLLKDLFEGDRAARERAYRYIMEQRLQDNADNKSEDVKDIGNIKNTESANNSENTGKAQSVRSGNKPQRREIITVSAKPRKPEDGQNISNTDSANARTSQNTGDSEKSKKAKH